MKTICYQRNEIIFNEGDSCNLIGFVKKGEIKIATSSILGNEIIYNIIKEGRYFGDHLIFLNNPHYLGQVISERKSEIVFYTKDEFINTCLKDKKSLEDYLGFIAVSEIAKNQTIKLLSLKDVKERFFFLLSRNGNKLSFRSIKNLADELHITRECCSRLVSRLCDEREIELDRKNKTIIKVVDL